MDDGNHEAEEDFIFNEYSIDDTLDPLSRLVKYHTSDFSLQRLVLIRELTDTAQYAGFQETVRLLIPLLNNFVQDAEPAVRQMFVQQLHPLAAFLCEAGQDAGYQHLLNTFLPFAFELLVDKNVEVGSAALTTLNKIGDLVKPQHVEQHLLNVVITLAHDERAEDYRVVAGQLFNDLATKFGEQLCVTMVLNEVKLLANDMSFTVRKTVGANLGNLAKVVGTSTTVEKILPVFLNLCKDDIWGVRKACAENIVAISEGISSEARSQQLVAAFKALSEDASRWVRVAAYQMLGQFIHTMRREDISPMFLKLFTDMAFQSEGGDSDFAEYCAFSFPAVVQVVGKERWREVDDAFATLLKDVQWKVRKSLAYSLHELAQVVGQDIAERSLAPAMELFFRDLDEVKFGVIQNADVFLKILGAQLREKFVQLICSVPLESENWRLRNAVAMKLGDIVQLVSPSSPVAATVANLIMKLLEDSVTEVRMSSYRSAAQTLMHLHSSPSEYHQFLNSIVGLATRPNFQSRQMFAYIAQQAVELSAADIVEKDLMDPLNVLSADKVSNVRFVVARVLANSMNNNNGWKSNPKVRLMTKTLADDPERDTATMAVALLPRVEVPMLAAAYRK
jgi:serine/threonine-protein phosphatase 4 regulatory subunit 1